MKEVTAYICETCGTLCLLKEVIQKCENCGIDMCRKCSVSVGLCDKCNRLAFDKILDDYLNS